MIVYAGSLISPFFSNVKVSSSGPLSIFKPMGTFGNLTWNSEQSYKNGCPKMAATRYRTSNKMIATA